MSQYKNCYDASRYKQRKGIWCWRCGKHLGPPPRTFCLECAAKVSAYRKARREQDRREGRCTSCHVKLTQTERSRGRQCPACRQKAKVWEIEKRKKAPSGEGQT